MLGQCQIGRKPNPLPPALLKKETQEFGRGPRLKQRRPCAKACSEKQPRPCQGKRCFSTPFSGDRRCCPSTPDTSKSSSGRVGVFWVSFARHAHLAWTFLSPRYTPGAPAEKEPNPGPPAAASPSPRVGVHIGVPHSLHRQTRGRRLPQAVFSCSHFTLRGQAKREEHLMPVSVHNGNVPGCPGVAARQTLPLLRGRL